MATIAEFFDKAEIKTKCVAARLQNSPRPTDPVKLYYHVVDKLGPVPPSVHLVEAMAAAKLQPKGPVMVNYAPVPWINANNELETKCERSATVTYTEAKAITVDMSRWDQFSLAKLGTKPTDITLYGDPVPRASSRARRIYMLGAFCLLKNAGTLKGWKSDGHNIASMLVSNAGEVLSWGVNDGQFRHAEVNTIISYFLRNNTATSLPAKSVLFTTLKPCQMCSKYIKSSWGTGEILIWFGMQDSGGSGGTPLLGTKAAEFTAENVEFDLWKEMDEELTTGTKPVQVLGKDGKKVGLSAALDKEEGNRKRLSAADWVDTSTEIAALFKAAQDKFTKKVNKPDRDDGPVKDVLAYLGPWLG